MKSEVIHAYRDARAWARWKTTFRLQLHESRARRRAHKGAFDQLREVRLKAVRDELAARRKPVRTHRSRP